MKINKVASIIAGLCCIQSAYAYECDGRQYCREMSTCDEAKWVFENCPNTRMDGDHDGIPCEDWCEDSNINYKSDDQANILFNNNRPQITYFANVKTDKLATINNAGE